MSDFNYSSRQQKFALHMKRALALFASVCLYIGLFQLCFSSIWNRYGIDDELLSWGFCIAVIGYFWIAGGLFYHYLGLQRWQLWVVMNIIGFLLSFPVFHRLEPWQEELDMIVLTLWVLSYLIVAWGVIGVWYICMQFISNFLEK